MIPFNTPTRAARARTEFARFAPRTTAESPAMPSQPSQSDAGPGRGRISRLDLVNFKSYGGKTTLGPFLDFSAVVGPNGAGAHRGSRGSRAGHPSLDDEHPTPHRQRLRPDNPVLSIAPGPLAGLCLLGDRPSQDPIQPYTPATSPRRPLAPRVEVGVGTMIKIGGRAESKPRPTLLSA